MNIKITPSTDKRRRRFYRIVPNDDGTVDVLLNPDSHPKTTDDGFTDYSFTAIVVRNVDPDNEIFDGDLDEHIRSHFRAWCESGEEISI